MAKVEKAAKWVACFESWLSVVSENYDEQPEKVVRAFLYEKGYGDALIDARASEYKMICEEKPDMIWGIKAAIALALTYRQLKNIRWTTAE